MNPLRHFARRALALAVLVLTLGATSTVGAQTISFTSAPTTLGMNTNAEIWLRADLPSGVYTNLAVELRFPSNATYPTQVFVNATGNPDFTLSNTVTAGVRTLRWTRAGTLDLSSGASNRQFLAIFYLDRIGTFDETPYTFTATLDGSLAGVPFTQSLAQHTITAQRAPGFNFFGTAQGYRNVVNPTAAPGAPDRYGVQRTLVFSMGNTSKEYLAPTTANITLGKDLRFVALRTVRSTQTALPDPIVSGAPTPWSANAGAYTLDVTTSQPPWDGNVDRIAFEVDVFIPCSDLPIGAPFADVEGSAAITGKTRDFYGVETTQSGSVLNLRVGDASAACGALGYFTNNWVNLSDSGQSQAWLYSFYAPYGITDFTNVLFAFRLPPDLVSFTNSSPSGAGWNVEHCNMSGLTFAGGAQFSFGELMTHRGARCHAGPTAGDTHVVYWRASYSETSSGPISTVSFSTRVAPDRVATHGTSLAMNAWFNASAATDITTAYGDQIVESTPNEDRWEATMTATLPTTLAPTATHHFDGPNVLDSNGGAAGTSYVRPRVGWSGYPPTNSRLTVEVPDGVVINSFSFDNSISVAGCNVPSDKMVWPSVADRPLVFQFGTTANPYTQPGECGGGPAIRINFTVDPTYPFFHEQTFQLRSTHTADNQTSQGALGTGTFQVIVAAGQDSRITTACDEEGAPTFSVLAVNRGRDPIADGVLRFVVPEDTTVTSVVPNADVAGSGGVIEVSSDDGASWGPDTGSYFGVTDVRLSGIAIAGGSASNLPPQPGFTVTVDPDVALGTIEGEVTMSSPGLGTTTPKIAPFEVGLCPGTVEVQVWFDADLDGQHDGDEVAVGAGHQVQLVLQAGSPSGFTTDVETTGPAGSVTFEGVTPGTYDVVYVGGPATAGTWSVSGPAIVTLANDGVETAELGLGCGCDDPTPGNVCSDAECNALGACVATWAELDSPCDDGAPDDACMEDRCQDEGFCGPAPMQVGADCGNPDPDNVCYEGGTCDGNGLCEPVYVTDGTLCGDATECGGFHCTEGYCLEEPLVGEECSDPTPEDPCTSGVCDGTGACVPTEANEGMTCDDPDPGNPCDAGECQAGECVAVPDREGGSCDDPDPDNPCDAGECQEGACVAVADNNGMVCDDPDPENPCDSGECSEGTCVAIADNDGGLCDDPTPGDPCTEGRCRDGACEQDDADDGTPCALEDLCVATAECLGGLCEMATAVTCDDDDACTADSCDPGFGCTIDEPACDSVAVAIPIVDADSGAPAGHVLCFVTPSATGGPGALTCDSGSGALVQHAGAGACGSP